MTQHRYAEAWGSFPVGGPCVRGVAVFTALLLVCCAPGAWAQGQHGQSAASAQPRAFDPRSVPKAPAVGQGSPAPQAVRPLPPASPGHSSPPATGPQSTVQPEPGAQPAPQAYQQYQQGQQYQPPHQSGPASGAAQPSPPTGYGNQYPPPPATGSVPTGRPRGSAGRKYAFKPELTNAEYGRCLNLEKQWQSLWQEYDRLYRQAQTMYPRDPRYIQLTHYLRALRFRVDQAWQAFSSQCVYFNVQD